MTDTQIAARIAAVQQQLEAENPGFAEYLTTYPEVVVVDLDEIVGQTDIYDVRSVARAYFIFAYSEFQQRNAGPVREGIVELMLQLFEDAMVGNPNERIARHRALLIGDTIELATGPTGADWYEQWGASIARLHEFEDKLRLKRRVETPTEGLVIR